MLGKLAIIKDAIKVKMNRKSPFKLTFAVTYKCNSRCTTCSIWKRSSKNELTGFEIKKFFQKNKFRWVNLTGGEVFLRPDIQDIVKNIPHLEILSITTNGLLTDKIMQDVQEILNHTKTLTMTISIDGPPEVHNKIRGIESWKQAVATLKQLKELSKQNSRLKVFAGYTISHKNAGMLAQTYQTVKEKVPDIQLKDFHLNIYHTSDVYFGNQQKEAGINAEIIMKDINALLNAKKGFDLVSILERKYMKKIQNYLKTGKCPMPCKSLLASVFMDPEGNIYPCTIMNENLGNIRDFNYSLKYILNQSKIKHTLRMIKHNECPGCWTACEAYQTIIANIGRIKHGKQ